MPGKPKLKQDLVILQTNTERVYELLAQGLSQEAVRAELGVSRGAWDRWLGSETGSTVYSRARASAAHGLVEEVITIADATPPDQAQVALARLRTDNRRWVAGMWNREAYSDAKGPTVAIQINGLHVGALRSRRVIEGESEPE